MNTTAKYLKSMAFFVAGFALLLPALAPQSTSAYIPISLIAGQSHSYDAQLRGDGSAVVNARLELKNNEDTAQKVYKYSAVSGTLSDILAFQEIQCADLPMYAPAEEPEGSTNEVTITPSSPTTVNEKAVTTTEYPECYPENNLHTIKPNSTDRDGMSYYYPAYKTFYKKVTVKQDGNSFVLTLPKEIASSEDATVVLVYNLADVAKKQLGVYDYDFKTLKTNERVAQSTVAISVDNDYVLEGSADDTINYKTGGTTDITESLKNGSNLSVSDNSAISSYVGSIGSNGTVTKTATNLASQETLNVTGRYATNEFLLHWPRTVLRVALVVLLIGLVISWYRRRRKQLRKKQWSQLPVTESPVQTTETTVAPIATNNASAVTPVAAVTVTPPSQPSVVNINLQALPFYSYFQARRLSSAAFGWLCALIASLFVGGIIWAITILDNSTYYGYSGTDTILAIVATLCLIAAGFLGFLLITIGLPFLYAPTFKSALKIIANVILTFVVIAVVLAVLLNVFNTQQEPDFPSYEPYYNDVPM